MFWQQHLKEIFNSLTAQDRKNVAEQLLTPNNIFWNGNTKTFEYREPISVSFGQVVSAIPVKFKNLKILANKIQASLEHLDRYTNALEIADYLENMLGKIAEFDTRDELDQQVHKQKLHRAFIYAVADNIRHKNELELPSNARKLHSNAVKVFINEVYLKQQLLGYWFKTLRNRQLKEFPHPLISEYLSMEQKGRQLEVVHASGYIFAIGPMLEYSANPFTIRRFLAEDRLYGGSFLLNGAALPTAYLVGQNETVEMMFKKQVSCIITVAGNVRRAIVDFVEQLDNYHEDQLISLLFSPFNVSAAGLEKDVAERLSQYEKRLKHGILQPMAQALRRLPNHAEEFDYMYVSMRQLMGSVVAAFKDFQMQPALLMNQDADVLLGRLVAYAAFLEKRRSDVFVEMQASQWAENSKKIRLLPNHAKAVAKEYIDEYLSRRQAVANQEKLLEKPETFFEKLFKTKEKQLERLDELKKSMRKVQYEAHKKLFNLPDEIKAQTVHMEFDTLLITDEKMRNYAFPNGDNGISELPSTFSLPENRLQFDLEEFARQTGVLEKRNKAAEEAESDEAVEAASKVLLKRV